MKALVSPNEPVQAGFRVAEIHETGFEVAPPLFWIDCDTSVVANEFWYDPQDQQFKPVPVVAPPAQPQPEVNGAQTL